MNSFSNCKNKEFNLDPDIWGPPTWIFLHSLAFGYPKNPTKAVKYETKRLIESLKYNLLPPSRVADLALCPFR